MSAIALPKDAAENAKVRRRLLWDGAHDPSAAYQIRKQCAEDMLFWVNGFCFTFDPRKKQPVLPFVAYEFQDDAMVRIRDAIRRGNDIGIEKSRDMGASWLNLIVLTWLWQFFDMQSFLVVSRNEDYVDAPGDSKSLFWKIDFLLKHQPRWLLPRSVNRTAMHIENRDNGSIIDGESTTGDVARGDRRTAILMDEYAAFEVSAGYKANASTMSATNCRIFNSTPRGTANAFYDLMHNAGTEIVRLHWSSHPEKMAGLYRFEPNKGKAELLDSWTGYVMVREKGTGVAKRVRFPEEYPFVQDGKLRSPWYDLQCSRATSQQEIGQELDIDYVGSDYQFFDQAAVAAYRRKWCRDPMFVGELDYDVTTGMPRRFIDNPRGHLSLWQPLDRAGRVPDDLNFVVGADISAGTGASNSAAVVYEARSHEKWAEYVNPNIEPRDFAVFVLALARFFNGALVVPDRSGPTGEQFVKRYTQEDDFPPLYRRFKDKKISKERVDEYGVFLNPQAKTSVLIEYRAAIGDVTIYNFSDRAVGESLQFVRRMDGSIEHSAALNAQDPSGAKSAHGDVVIADALANVALSEQDDAVRKEPREIPPDSVAGRMMARRKAEARARNKELIGGGW